MVRRIRGLAVAEPLCIPVFAAVALLWEMPFSTANTVGLGLLFLVLAEGGAYWWAKRRQLVRGLPLPPGMPVFAVLKRVNLALLAAGAAAIAAAPLLGDTGTRFWPGVLLWLFAVVEQVNYFHVQLSHDNRADLARLLRTRRLHRSHLARDLDRARRRPAR
ncbi:hypothetical protein [Nocardiopsis potens]|uniref:hypothetical protein n=1 Tax=Nocardiopsis potens TaxID=1246458 RepID=UPI0003467D80|nr:hypothetical protein [Nocardiopsis potens]